MMLPGPAVIWTSDWVGVPTVAEDVSGWPFFVCLFTKWVTFLGTLHWPAAGADLVLVGFPM